MTAPTDSHASIAEALRLLARPRLAGTPTEIELRRRVAETLAALGCSVREEPFAYDPFWVRQGFGYVLGAAALVLVAGAFGPHPLAAAGVAFVLVAPLILVAGTGSPRIDRRPRQCSANLVATLDGSSSQARGRMRPPDVVLMAHIDSKSQGVSFVARSACATVGLGSLVVGTIALAAGAPELLGRGLLLVAALGTAPLAVGATGNASPGALDNATGVAVVLELMKRFAADARTGLSVAAVITSAEEDGLVGAHRFAEAHAAALGRALVVNVDTIGPGDRLVLLVHGRRAATSRVLARACAALDRAASTSGMRLVRRRVPFPAGVDSHPLARAGVPALSLATGGVRDTFRHLHRPSDTLARVDVAAVVRVVDVVERAVRTLHPGGDPPDDARPT